MKKVFLFFITLLLLSSCSPDVGVEPLVSQPSCSSALKVGNIDNPEDEILGIWIASVYNINFPSAPDLDADKLKEELNSIVDTVKSLGLNTVFFQAHPSADALYKSDLFPVSKFLSSSGELNFDPLEYITEICHENEIKLHVWINPLRVTTTSAKSREVALNSLGSSVGAGTTPELLVYYDDGKLYYNSGLPEVQNLVTECVEEIVTRYDIDGIVFDDYFYPYPVDNAIFDDNEAYKKYGNGAALYDWRRENINTIIKNVYAKIKSLDSDCLFGVSPFGIWQNNNGSNGGSDTNGFESYTSIYCDSLSWAVNGYVDYLSPQLYWSCDNDSASFEVLCDWWNSKLECTGCDLIPSLAPFRYENDWINPEGEITEQISLSRSKFSYKGLVYYGYDSLKNNVKKVSDEVIESSSNKLLFYDISNQTIPLKITSHKNGCVVSSDSVTLYGYSDPDNTLYCNNDPVSRKKGGYFEIKLPLNKGENIFSFANGDEILNFMIYCS